MTAAVSSSVVMENPPTIPATLVPSPQTAAATSTKSTAVLPPSIPEPPVSQSTKSPEAPRTSSVDAPGGVKDMRMQRGVKPEAEIEWDTLRTLHVLDEMGNKIKFTDIFKKQKTIIFLVRHFLCFICKEYVEDLAVIPYEYLQNADVRLVVIGPAEHTFIRAFKDLTHFNYTLYTDPERKVYKAFGCQEKLVAGGDLYNSKHIKSGFISGVTSSIWRAMTTSTRKLQGNVKQQGGTFILGPEEHLHFSHIDQTSTDHCPINEALTAAGVQNVSFPKDPRIQSL